MNIIDSLSEGIDDPEGDGPSDSKDVKCQSSTSSYQEPTNESSNEAENTGANNLGGKNTDRQLLDSWTQHIMQRIQAENVQDMESLAVLLRECLEQFHGHQKEQK